MKKPVPTDIILHKKSRMLEVIFDNQEQFLLPCEYLRVFSPSAEMRIQGEQKWLTGKEQVNILSIESVGHYAIKPTFSDGHATGIFSWEILYNLGRKQAENWNLYKLKKDKI